MKRVVLLCVLALPALLLAFHRVDNADVWFHLATGDRILAARNLPASDPFTATPPPGGWVVHDWLAGVLFAALFRLAGFPALVTFTTLVFGVALAWPLARAWRAAGPTWPYALALLVATGIAYERFFVRPECISILFAAVWVQVLADGGPRRWRSLAALGLVQVLWTNAHAAFLLGPLLAFAALAGDALDRGVRRRRSGPALPRPRLALPLVAALACLVTPYGPRLLLRVIAAWHDVGSPALRAGIVEWQPTFSHPIAGDFVLMLFVASLAGVAAAAVAGRRVASGFEWVVAVAMTALACSSRRHLTLYAVTVLPLAARWVAAARSVAGRRAWVHRGAAFILPALALGFAADVARGSFYARCGPPRTLGWGVSAADHPIASADLVAREHLPGPLFNNVAAGSYLIWRLQGDPPVLVDGRLLDPELFGRYRRCLESPAEFDAFAAARGIRTVVLDLRPFPPVQLVRHLYGDAAWRLVQLDGEGAVFVRDTVAANNPRLASLRLESPLPAAPVGAAGHGPGCDPGEAWRRGDMLLQLRFATAATADLTRALLHCPARWDIGLALSTALLATGRAAEALPLVERALDHDAANVDAWVNLGLCRAAAGDRAEARACWQRAAALQPADPRPAQLLRGLDG